MRETLKHYRIDLGIAGFVAAGVLLFIGVEALIQYFILGVLEISFSFDNAVVNAAVLATMSLAWQRRFMTWGILIAVVGMRFIFPIVIVMVTAGLGFVEVVQLAVQHPLEYAERLHEAHPQITILAGTYLLLIFLSFIFEKREVTWLGPIERLLAKVGKLDQLPVIIAGAVVVVLSQILHNNAVLVYGIVSLLAFLLVNALASIFESEDEELENDGPSVNGTALGAAATAGGATGLAGFTKFLYLEVQDASFSFDGVSGAFAITSSVILIAIGLGIGALFVRSMTMHLLRTNARAEFRYLEHGAYWAIGTLALCMLATLFVEIPEYVTGLIGVVFIGAAVLQSIRANKRDALEVSTTEADANVATGPIDLGKVSEVSANS